MAAIGNLFRKQKLPSIQAASTDEDADRKRATEDRLRRFESARASTILGGGLIDQPEPALATKRLLGG